MLLCCTGLHGDSRCAVVLQAADWASHPAEAIIGHTLHNKVGSLHVACMASACHLKVALVTDLCSNRLLGMNPLATISLFLRKACQKLLLLILQTALLAALAPSLSIVSSFGLSTLAERLYALVEYLNGHTRAEGLACAVHGEAERAGLYRVWPCGC